MKNPSLLEKLRAEIDQAWSSNENPTPPPPLEVLDNLPLLEGVVKESLRLASSVPGPLWRVAGDDCIIDDIPVPRGVRRPEIYLSHFSWSPTNCETR